MTKEQECMKALQCLYLEVPSVIADDIKQKVIDALNEVKNCTIPPEIEVEVKATWVKYASIFVRRYIKSKWLLRQLCKLTVAKIYCNGKLSKKVTLGEYLPSF